MILRNRIRCLKCGDIIESKTRHDFVMCSCGACGVDGGAGKNCFYQRIIGEDTDYENLTEYSEEDDK